MNVLLSTPALSGNVKEVISNPRRISVDKGWVKKFSVVYQKH